MWYVSMSVMGSRMITFRNVSGSIPDLTTREVMKSLVGCGLHTDEASGERLAGSPPNSAVGARNKGAWPHHGKTFPILAKGF